MTKSLSVLLLVTSFTAAIGQQRPGSPNPAGARPEPPKPYKEVITEKAISHTGLMTVHKVEDKWYFEIPDSIFGRDILVSTR